MAASKKVSRKTAAKKAAKTRKSKVVAKKKAAKAPKRQAARKKAAATRRKRTAVVKAAVSPAVSELDQRIAILRNNLRDLTEQAAASSGASTEELMSARITEQETQLRTLTKQRDDLVRRGS